MKTLSASGLRQKSKWIIVTLILMSFLSFEEANAQPALIAQDAANNIYPITFTTVGQNQLRLVFNANVSAGPVVWPVTGWSITGTAATITNVASNLNFIQVTLSSAITYAERLNVRVTYNGTGTTPITPFANVLAYNNYLISCNDFNISSINLDNGAIVCQPVTISVTGNVIVPANARNSIYFNETSGLRLNFVWLTLPLTNELINVTGRETSAGSGIFEVKQASGATITHDYTNINDCQISPYVYMMYYFNLGDYMDLNDPDGGADHRLRCNDASYIIQEVFPIFCTDNLYSGQVNLNDPAEGRQWCLGKDIPGVQFINGTLLNCRMTAPAPYGPLSAEEANRSTRWVRYIYGTHAGAGIPDVYVEIGGVMTQVTDASGNVLVPGGIIGEVQEYLSPQDAAQGMSERIYHTGNYITDAVDDVFGVTMQVWNQCNPYELDPFSGLPVNPPVTDYNDLILIDGPIAIAGPDEPICANATFNTNGSVINATSALWTTSGTGSFANATSPDNAVYTASAADTIAGFVDLTLHAYAAGLCAEHTDVMRLTLVPIPKKPSIDITGDPDANFCFDNGATTTTLTASIETPPLVDHWQWYKNGDVVVGANTNTITLGALTSHQGTYTVRAFGEAPTSCPGILSDPVNVVIHTLDNLTHPVTVTVCEGGSATFTASTTEPASFKWEISTDGGSTWGPVGGAAPHSGWMTPTLTVNPVPYSVPAVQYRCEVRTDPSDGNCPFFTNAATLNVNPLPADITGTLTVCAGSTTDLDNATAGGTWSSLNAAVATVAPATGVVTGVSAGTAVIRYTLASGCFKAVTVTVNPLPANITGTTSVCVGSATDLNNATAGGTWSSTNTAVATVDATGLVTGITSGTADIRYTLATGCFRFVTVTVNGLPANITGTLTVCVSSTTDLNNATAGGTWTSLNAAVATVHAVTGLVTGVSAGTANIRYTLPTGCYRQVAVTVNALPAAITGTTTLCVGSTSDLNNATAGGTWSSTNAAVATVDGTGLVTAISAGTADIRYTLATGCFRAVTVTINPLPANITGTLNVCVGSTTDLNNATAGGTWSSLSPGIATVNATGLVTGVAGGTAEIRYTLPTSCYRSATVTVNARPVPTLGGPVAVCLNSTGNVYTTDAGMSNYIWNVSAGGTITAGGGAASNTVTVRWDGGGAQTVSVNYTDANGCTAVAATVLNVAVGFAPVNATITGSPDGCVGPASWFNIVINGGGSPYDIKYTKDGVPQADILDYVSNTNYNLGVLPSGDHQFIITEIKDNCGNNVPAGSLPGTLHIKLYEIPNADAGGDQQVCGSKTTTLDATPSFGIGTWTLTGVNPGVISGWGATSANNPDGTPTVTAYGTYNFKWTELNVACSDEDIVVVTFSENPSGASSGVAPVPACDALSTTLAGIEHTYAAAPNVNAGTQTWVVDTKPHATSTVTFTSVISPTSGITVNHYGTYTLHWREINGNCTVDAAPITITFYESPDGASAGAAPTPVCDALITTLAGTEHTYAVAPNVNSGTQVWSVTDKPGAASTVTFTDVNSPTSGITVNHYGSYTLRWTETNGNCTVTSDVTIVFNENPDGASSGIAPTPVCDALVATLAGTEHTYAAAPNENAGSQTWVVDSKPHATSTVTFTSIISPTSGITVNHYGTYTLHWREINGNCTVNAPAITITFYENPDGASSGVAPVPACDALSATLAGTEHTYAVAPHVNSGTQTWVVDSKPHATSTVTFTSISSPTSGITVNHYGSYTLHWREINGNCTVDAAPITITFYERPDGASAGAAPTPVCDALITTLAGTEHTYAVAPNVNSGTQVWSVTDKPGAASTVTFTDVNSPTSGITVNHYGSYTLRWTETNGNCTVTSDVTIVFNENPDGASSGIAPAPVCDALVATLAGTEHAYAAAPNENAGTQTWVVDSKPHATSTVTFTSIISPTSGITVNHYGSYTLHWREVNGNCTVDAAPITITFYERPDGASAGAAPTPVCDALVTTLAGTEHTYALAPNVNSGTQVWSVTDKPGAASTVTFTDVNSPTSGITVNHYGSYTLRWTETNGNCTVTSDVTIVFNENPDGASSGIAPTPLCDALVATLAGTEHTYAIAPNENTGTQTWIVDSKPHATSTVTFTSVSSPTSGITVNHYGSYTLHWREVNGNCIVNAPAITITFYENPDGASSGVAPVPACDALSATLAGTEHTYAVAPHVNSGTQTWVVDSKPHATSTVTFTSISSPTSGITVNHYGSYTLHWREINGNCTVDAAPITLTFYESPTADAGPDGNINAVLTHTLGAIPFVYTPAPNVNVGTHTWSLVSSTTGGIVTSWGAGADTPDPAITVDRYGEYVLRWTETNGPCAHSDEVTLRFVEGASAGPDQDLCNILTTVLAANTPSAGFGTWSQVSGPGTITFTDINNPATAITADQYGLYQLQWTLSVGVPPFNQALVSIDFNELPTANAGVDYEICYAPAINLAGLIGGGASTGTWSMIAGGAGIVGASTTVAPDVTAAYTLDPTDATKTIIFRLTTDDPAGTCPSVFDDISVKINPLPVTSAIDGDVTLCEGEDNIVYRVVATAGSTYLWSVPPQMTITTNFNHVIIVSADSETLPGAKITVTETNDKTCVGVPVELPVVVSPSKLGEVINGPDEVCQGATIVRYWVSFTSGSVYDWSPPAGSVPVGPTDQFEIFLNFPVAITSDIQVIETNGACTTFHLEKPVTVKPKPTLSSSLTPPAICSGTFNYTATSAAPSPTFAWSRAAVAGILEGASAGAGNVSETLTNTTLDPIVVTYVYTVTSGGCTGDPQNVTVVVNPAAHVDDPADQVVCAGGSTAAVGFTSDNTGGSMSFTWTNDNTAIGLGASGSGSIPPFIATNAGDAPITANITVTPHFTNGGITCDGAGETFTIIVNPAAKVVDPDDQVVCNGENTAAVNFLTPNTGGTVTYTWTNSNPSIGLAASGSGDVIASFAAVNAGNSPVVATITVTPKFSNGGVDCTGASQSFTITINPDAKVNDPANQVVCNGAPVAAINFTTPNTGGTMLYSWTNSAAGIGLALSGTGDIASFTAINTGTTPIVATIEVTPSFTNAGKTCGGVVQTFTITINPTAQVDLPSNQVVCHGEPVTAVNFETDNTVGTTTYTWTNSATGIGLPATGSGNIASFTASNTGTSPVVATITVTPHFENAGKTCDGPAQTFTITVNPLGQVNDPANQTVCEGDPVTAIDFQTVNTVGTTTFAWTNSETGIGLAAAGSDDIPSFVATNAGTTPLTATITVTPTFDNGGHTCVGPAQTFTITVNPNGQVNAIADQVVCNGASTAMIEFETVNTVGTTTYSWTNSAPGIGLPATGSGNIPVFTATNAGNGQVVANIEVTPHFTYNGVTCDGTPETFTITVNPTAKVNDPADQVVCDGGNTAAVNFSTDRIDGITTYTWTNDSPGIGLGAGGSGNIPSFVAANAGDAPVTATIVVTPHYDNSGETCDGPSQSFTITVNPLGQMNDPADQVVCNGGMVTAINFTTDRTGGVTTYTWTNSASGVGLAASGSGNIGSFTAVNAGTSPIVATITVTPKFTFGGEECTGTPQTFTITVNPTANVVDPADQVVCNGELTTAVAFTTSNGGGTMTYNWTNTASGVGLAASGTGNIPAFTAVNTGTAPIVATITVTPLFENGSVTCSGPSQSFNITVNPTAQVNDPANQVVCNGAPTTLVTFTSNNTGGTTTYSWTNSASGVGLAASGSGNIASFIAENTGTSPVVATITVTPHFTNDGKTCDGPVETFTITVNPSAQVDDPGDQVVCAGAAVTAVNFTTINTGGTTTYSWTNSAPGIGLGAGGTGDIASFNAINTGSSPVVATITVTPHFENGSVSCNGTPQTFTITVNPTAQVNDPANQVVCNGDFTSIVAFTTTNSGGTTTYSWTNDTPTIGIGASGTGNIPAFVAANPGTAPIVATITVTPDFENDGENCSGPAQTFTITINPDATVLDPADQVVCDGQSTATVVFGTTNTGGTMTYTWSNDDASIGLAVSGSGNIPFFTATNSTTAPVTATITVTPHFTNGAVTCDGTPQDFIITVNPKGQVDNPGNKVVCDGAALAAINFTTVNTVGTTTYSWTNTASGMGLAASGSGDIASFTAINAGTSPIVATITVTPHFTFGLKTCDGPSEVFTITVNPTAQVSDPADQAACNGVNTAPINFTTDRTGGVTTYTWTNSASGVGLAASGSGNIPSFSAINTGTAPVVATITVTPHFDNASLVCDGPAQTFTITVNPTAQVNDPANQVVCNGAAVADINFTTLNTIGTTTYTWVNDQTSIGLAAIGSGNIATFPAVNIGNVPVIATITVTPHFAYAGKTCDGPAQTFTITVNPTAQVNDPANIVACNTDNVSVNFTTTNSGGAMQYDWTNDNISIGLPAAGIGNIGPFAATNAGTSPVTATIVVTPSFTFDGRTCTGPAQTFTITVNPTGQVDLPASQTVCNGTYTTPVMFTTGNTGGTTTYTWANSAPGIGLPATGTGNISAFPAVNAGTSPVVATITVTPHFTNGLVTCDGTPQIFTITVNPTAQVNDISNQVVCNGNPTTLVTFGTDRTGGTVTYTWTNSAPGIGLPAAGMGNIASFTATNAGTAPVMATITVTPHFDNAGKICDGPPKTFTITVNPTAQVNNPGNQTACNNVLTTAINFATVNTGGTTTYTWTNDNASIGLAAIGSGNIPAFMASNATAAPVTATIIVTPHFENGAVICDGPAKTFTITVNPTPSASTASPTTICSGASTNIALTSPVAGTTFSWTIGGTTGAVSGASASSGSTIDQILVNSGVTPGTVRYVVTPLANGCAGTPVDIVVTVNPEPNAVAGGLTTICSNTITNIPLSGAVAGTTYSWTLGPITGGIAGASASGGPVIAQTLVNPGTTAGTVTYIVTPRANGCDGVPINVVVTVNPTPDVTTASPTTICSNTATNIVLTGSVAGTTYSWTIGTVTGSLTGATASNGSTIAQTLVNSGLTPAAVEYIVTPTANSCSGAPLIITVTVNPLTGPVLFSAGPMEVCQDAPDATYTATATSSTSIVYSVAPAGAGVINPATGVMNWDPAFFGNATITATATGLCNTTVGNLTVRVKELPAITTQPVSQAICEFGVVNFDVTATGADLTYQWFVDPGTGTFIPASGGNYTGETSPTLQIWNPTRAMDGYRYHVVVSGCLPDVTSVDVVLTINTAPEFTLHPVDTKICLGGNETFEADATGTSVTWQWFVNKGLGFVPVVDDANFSGSATRILTITNGQPAFNNWTFRAQATGVCGAPSYTNFGRLTVVSPPVPTVHPANKVTCENGSVTMTANGTNLTDINWEVSTDNGATWADVTDAGPYLGSGTNQLSINNAPVSMNLYQYRLKLIGECTTVFTNAATLTVNPNPVVTVADMTACGGVAEVLNGNPTGGTAPYVQHRWTGDVGPLGSYTVQSPTFNTMIPGAYSLTYTVTDSKGCMASGTMIVTVDSPSADFTSSGNAGCTPFEVNFYKDMTGIASFTWDFGDGSPVNTTVANPAHQYINTDPTAIEYHSAKLTVVSAGGCSIEKTMLITVYPSVTADITADKATICHGETITFSSLPGASTYEWNYGDGVMETGSNVAKHPYINISSAAIVRTVTVKTTSFYGCSDTKTMDVTVLPKPVPAFSSSPVQQVYNAAGNPVSFTNETNAGPFTWAWSFGDGGTSTDMSPSHTYNGVGEYNVTLEVTNGTCTEKVIHKVYVNPLAPIAAFDSIPPACEPLEVTFNNTTLNANIPGTTYKWDFGDGGSSVAKNPTYTWFDPGTYRVELTVTGPGGISISSKIVRVYPTPVAAFDISPTMVFVNDEKVQGFNLSVGADYYVWEWGDGDTSKVKDAFHKYMEAGVFDVSLSAYRDNGGGNICYDKFTLSPGVTVEPAGEIRFSSVFKPNLDGPVEVSQLPTGGEELDQFFFPPIREKVLDYKLQVFNRQGVLLFESRDINIPWNGYYKGQLCQQGVYVWYVEGKYANGKVYKMVGDITLLH